MSKLLKYESPAYKQKLKSYNYRQSEFSLKFDAEHRKADSKWDFRKPRSIYISCFVSHSRPCGLS